MKYLKCFGTVEDFDETFDNSENLTYLVYDGCDVNR